MAKLDSGSSDAPIAPTHRTGYTSLFEEDHVGQRGEQRRAKQLANPGLRSLFDLLFEEVESFEEIDEPARSKLKQNIRRSIQRRRRGRAGEHGPGQGGEEPAEGEGHEDAGGEPAGASIQEVVVPAGTISAERLTEIATEVEDERNTEEVQEALRVAEQLRYCMAQHTETAFKVATYLRAMLVLNGGNYKPKMVIEV